MSCPLAKYSDIFGKPNEGVHSIRVLDIAVVDVFGTILIAGAISYLKNYNFFIVFIITFLIAIFLHRIFCVNTTVNKFIFGEV